MRLLRLALLCTATIATAAGIAGAGAHPPREAPRYDDERISFFYPPGWRVEPAGDPNADLALTVRGGVPELSFTLLVGGRAATEHDLETLADRWHAARVKSRVGWGLRADGGPPRETIQSAGRRYLRFRDRVQGVLGGSEQTMTCGASSGHLVCAVVSTVERERADAVALALLPTVTVKRR